MTTILSAPYKLLATFTFLEDATKTIQTGNELKVVWRTTETRGKVKHNLYSNKNTWGLSRNEERRNLCGKQCYTCRSRCSVFDDNILLGYCMMGGWGGAPESLGT